MPLSVDAYLSRRFHLARMNCWHLVRDAWLEMTGVDLGDLTPDRLTRDALTARFDDSRPLFTKLAFPADPCIVLMSAQGAVPHVGIYHRRRVLQMTMGGASYVPLEAATAGFSKVEYFK